jgi:hypothetical protein
MLCIDADRPKEFMFHVYGEGKPPFGFLTSADFDPRRNVVELKPMRAYQPKPNTGGIGPAAYTQEIQELMVSGRATLRADASGILGEWTAPGRAGGKFAFNPPPAADDVDAEKCESWDDFKQWVRNARRDFKAETFRGQGSNEFRLSTTLHRAGRSRLDRYCTEELPRFSQLAEVALDTAINLNDGAHYSTTLGLAQHHGLPSPLLDWTRSPYIAAFFAFADALENKRDGVPYVRVYSLTEHWTKAWPNPVITVDAFGPYAFTLEVSPRRNPRLYAQQGTFLVTNVEHVGHFIRTLGKV